MKTKTGVKSVQLTVPVRVSQKINNSTLLPTSASGKVTHSEREERETFLAISLISHIALPGSESFLASLNCTEFNIIFINSQLQHGWHQHSTRIVSCFQMKIFDDPVLLVPDSEPRILDSVFNVTGLVNNFLNTSNNALVTYVGGVVLFIVLLGIDRETQGSDSLTSNVQKLSCSLWMFMLTRLTTPLQVRISCYIQDIKTKNFLDTFNAMMIVIQKHEGHFGPIYQRNCGALDMTVNLSNVHNVT